MESSSIESQKKTKSVDANDTKDRISSLSDEIIGLILSLLPTKYAVATSILSKRWRFLWTNITNLDFGYYYPRVSDDENFHNFVDTVLHRCTSKQFHSFQTTFKVKPDRLQAWVNEVFRRHVYELQLQVSKLPSFISTCNTLTILRLYAARRSEFEIPASTYFPNLRILAIAIRCPSNILTEKLFRSCPALEDLDVRAKGVGKDSNFFISAPVLKRLSFNSDLGKISNGKLVINAPNLEYMYLSEMQMADYVVENLSSIAKAYVDFGDMYNSLDGETIANRALELLRGLQGIKSLSFGSYTMMALDRAYPLHLPIYYNITQLELTIDGVHNGQNDGRRILPCFLEVSPKLKVLILHMVRAYVTTGFFESLSGGSDWVAPQSLPECLSSCLELVRIDMFLGTEYELKMVEYLLGHAACLKELIIKPVKLSPEAKVAICQKLLKLPRNSKTCEVCLLD